MTICQNASSVQDHVLHGCVITSILRVCVVL